MLKGIKYDNDFIIGSGLNTRITPNFKVKEFIGRGGHLYMHWEPRRVSNPGYQAYRDNLNLYLLRDLAVSGTEQYLDPEQNTNEVG